MIVLNIQLKDKRYFNNISLSKSKIEDIRLAVYLSKEGFINLVEDCKWRYGESRAISFPLSEIEKDMMTKIVSFNKTYNDFTTFTDFNRKGGVVMYLGGENPLK